MTTPADVNTYVEPGEGDDDNSLMVSVSITDPSGTSWVASGHADLPISDDDLAAMILNAAAGAAALRSPGVWMALQRRLSLEE